MAGHTVAVTTGAVALVVGLSASTATLAGCSSAKTTVPRSKRTSADAHATVRRPAPIGANILGSDRALAQPGERLVACSPNRCVARGQYAQITVGPVYTFTVTPRPGDLAHTHPYKGVRADVVIANVGDVALPVTPDSEIALIDDHNNDRSLSAEGLATINPACAEDSASTHNPASVIKVGADEYALLPHQSLRFTKPKSLCFLFDQDTKIVPKLLATIGDWGTDIPQLALTPAH